MVDQANVPADPLQQLLDNLAETHKELADRIAEQAVGVHQVPDPITPEQEPLVLDFVRQCNELLKRAEDMRKATKKPFDDQAATVQKYFVGLKAVLQGPLTQVKERHGKYRQEQERLERERREAARREAEQKEREEREEAQRLAREAAEKAAAAKTKADREQAAADLQRAEQAKGQAKEAGDTAKKAERQTRASTAVHGDLGGSAHVARRWAFDLDPTKVDLEALRPHFKVEHLEMTVRAFMKAQGDNLQEGTDQLHGVNFYKEAATRYR